MKSIRLPLSVQVFLVRIIDGQRSYLLFQRNARPELGLPDFWQGVSGALEAGESFSDAARREVAEETGIILTSVVDTGFQRSYPIRSEWRRHYGPEPSEVIEHIFFAEVQDATEPVLSQEHKSWQWCSVAEASGLLTFGYNSQCLLAVDRCLTKSPNK